jgi:protocatechuate 3,4-dioxygenase beta subunit
MLRRLIVALAVTFLAQALVAQDPAQPPGNSAKTQKPPGNCTVSGRVIGAADGMPLRSARVGLIQADARERPQVYGDTTDNEGRFEIKKVLAGRYQFFATHTGYLEQKYQAKGTGRTEGAMLSLLPAQEVTDVLFRLVRAGVITGRVVDDAGEPMIGVNVAALHKPSEEEREDFGPRAKKVEMTTASVTHTDDRGEYRIHGLKPGEYYVKDTEVGFDRFMGGEDGDMAQERTVLRTLGSQFAPMYYPGVMRLDQAQPVMLQAGEEIEADFAMRRIKLVEVAGRVMGAMEVRRLGRMCNSCRSVWRTGRVAWGAAQTRRATSQSKACLRVLTTSARAHMNEERYTALERKLMSASRILIRSC